jgi:hypothetical protein
VKRVRIFVASPGDVSEEREIVSMVVDELRRIVGKLRHVELEAVRWETHAWPDIGDGAQDVINRQIGQYDIFVGIMWKRFGTPTKRADSGTAEEFDRAYTLFRRFGRPKIMFYFRTTPFYSTSPAELSQFGKVVRFRRKLEGADVLFWNYDRPLQFERVVREHLIRQLLELTVRAAPGQKKQQTRSAKRGGKKKTLALDVPRPRVFISAAREDHDRVLPIYRALQDAGSKPWLDVENLLPGELWQEAIRNAIRASDIFLVFLSNTSISRSGYFQKELRLALDLLQVKPERQTYVIPVRLDPVMPPPPLAELHWIDAFTSEGVERLIETIRRATPSR